MSWFRFYTEVLNDPKVQRLDPVLFKAWVNLLCLAKQNDGTIGTIEDVSFALRETFSTVSSWIKTLEESGLLDQIKHTWEPHNWRKRQYKSDISTERVKRHRKRRRNVSETPPEQSTEQSRTETENKGRANGADPPLSDMDKVIHNYGVLASDLGLPSIRVLTPQRKKKLKARIDEVGLDGFRAAFANARASPFLQGQNERGWKMDFDFLLQPGSLAKLIEGSYGGTQD